MFDFSIIDKLKTHYIFGFDVHGVIDRDPKGFKKLFHELKGKGHEIYIISGPPADEIIEELKEMGIIPFYYIKVLSVVDFLKSKKIKMWQDENDNWWTTDVNWWSAKARICAEYNVDYMLDNTYTYSHFFDAVDTEFIHIMDED